MIENVVLCDSAHLGISMSFMEKKKRKNFINPETDGRFGAKMPPERLALAIEMITKFARPTEIIRALQAKWPEISDGTGWYTVTAAYNELDKDGVKRPWRKASVLAALTRTYQNALERADPEVLLERVRKAGANEKLVSRLIYKFDPERATMSALKALDQMTKIHGFYATEKHEHTVVDNSVADDPKLRKERIAELLAKQGMIIAAAKKAIDADIGSAVQEEIKLSTEDKPN